MATHKGRVEKMRVSDINPVLYTWDLGEDSVEMNALLGKEISLRFENEIQCIVCDKTISKSYGQGFCFTCFNEAPENAECIIHPELCEGHLGKGRNPQWELEIHVKEHLVYLALSSAVKVGVTRYSQIPTRWIDQGASEAIILAKTPYRKLAGLIEVELKKHFTDKTNWQQMLRNERTLLNLEEEKKRAASLLPEMLQPYVQQDSTVTAISYPVLRYPEKVQSINLDKTPEIQDRLLGIKGQYLIFENAGVINVRNHSGYIISLGYE